MVFNSIVLVTAFIFKWSLAFSTRFFSSFLISSRVLYLFFSCCCLRLFSVPLWILPMQKDLSTTLYECRMLTLMLWYEHQCTTNLCPHRNCFIIWVNKYWPYYNVHRPLRNENGYSFAVISSTVFLSFHLLIFSSCRRFVALFNFILFLNKNISQSCIVFSLLVCHHMISVFFFLNAFPIKSHFYPLWLL